MNDKLASVVRDSLLPTGEGLLPARRVAQISDEYVICKVDDPSAEPVLVEFNLVLGYSVHCSKCGNVDTWDNVGPKRCRHAESAAAQMTGEPPKEAILPTRWFVQNAADEDIRASLAIECAVAALASGQPAKANKLIDLAVVSKESCDYLKLLAVAVKVEAALALEEFDDASHFAVFEGFVSAGQRQRLAFAVAQATSLPSGFLVALSGFLRS